METTPIKSQDLPPGVSPVSKTDDGAAKLLDKIGGFGAYLHKAGVRPGVGNVLFSLKGLLDVGKLSPGKADHLDAPHADTTARANDTQQQAPAQKNGAADTSTHRPDDASHDDRRRQENSAHRDDAPTPKTPPRNDTQGHAPAAPAKAHDDAPDTKHAADSNKDKGDDAPAAANVPTVQDTAKPPAAPVVEVAGLAAQVVRQNTRDTPTPRSDDGSPTPLKKGLGGKAQNVPHIAPNTAQEEAAKASAAAGKATPTGIGKQNHQLGSSHGAPQTQDAATPATKLDSETAARQQQAQALARTLGDDARMKVHVNVKDDAATLKSQTSASLAPQAALANARGQSQGAKSPNNHAMAQEKAPHLAQGPVIQPQGAAQIGAVQAAFDAALKAANGGGATASALNASGASSAAAPSMGGGESAQAASLGSPTGPQAPTQQSAGARKAASPPPTPAHKPVAEQVSVQITKALADGLDKIRIQLRPASMGRVDVQIELSRDGHVSAVISADNKHTLDMLKQDSRELQKALQAAGLQTGTGDLTFNLNENGAQGGDGAERQSPRLRAVKEPSLEDLLSAGPEHTDVVTKDRVDIRA